MSKVCAICEKGPISGQHYKRRGQIKRTGGAGAKVVGKTFRQFIPNLQKIKVNIKGTVKRIHVCTKCLKAGKITKAA
jgi:large subunit ribosomal protein L28